MIAIIDYGVGNLFSITRSLSFLGIESKVTSEEKEIRNADRIILPGVGAFGDARKKLDEKGLSEVLTREVKSGKPLLGICLGMQLLFDCSYEYGFNEGLGFIGGKVCPLSDDVKGLKIPQMGWNSLKIVKDNPLLKYLSNGEFVYFVHSYYAKECDKSLIATTDYGIDVTAAVQNGNVFGTQFHPEKSGESGLKILKAFNEIN
ncbi:MAG: imidazole glycerol phosphate synthase subunit HisH [Christensenellales bacterium]